MPNWCIGPISGMKTKIEYTFTFIKAFIIVLHGCVRVVQHEIDRYLYQIINNHLMLY